MIIGWVVLAWNWSKQTYITIYNINMKNKINQSHPVGFTITLVPLRHDLPLYRQNYFRIYNIGTDCNSIYCNPCLSLLRIRIKIWTRAFWKPSKPSGQLSHTFPSRYVEILIRLLQLIYVVSTSVGRFLQISAI